ncbi:MAG: AAA family ATPase [Euryarchaeota archaeon]|jgi:adenylate kinase|nr:AAA family ATPase [Euryarchaeota archaeon]
MRICITGTPGTGKTSVARLIPMEQIELNDFARKNDCISGYDTKRNVDIVDIDCLKKKIKKRNNILLVGHYSHFLECDIVIVLRTNPEILESRLRKRGYDENKIMENVEAEALGLITQEAMDLYKDVYEIDTTNIKEEDVANIILKIIKGDGEEYRAGKIDYLEWILRWY